MVVGQAEVPVRPQPLAQPGVVGVAQEPSPQRGNGPLHTQPQSAEGTYARLHRVGPPALQPAVLGAGLGIDGLKPALVAQQVEHGEVAEDLAVEHGSQVELHVGLAHEAGGVTKKPQRRAVGQQGPQVLARPVQQFLHHGVGRPLGGAGDTGRAPVEVDPPPEEVHGNLLPHMAHREAAAVGDDPPGRRRGHSPEAQLPQHHPQPLVPSQGGGPVARGQGREGVAERSPGTDEHRPRPVGRLPGGHAELQPVGIGAEPGKVSAGDDAGQEVGRHDAPDGAHGGQPADLFGRGAADTHWLVATGSHT